MTTIKLNIPVRVDYGDVRTVLSAERVIRGLATDLRWYGPDHPSADEWMDGIQTCAEAISLTTGETVPAIMERLDDAIERTHAARVKASDKHWNALRAAQPHLDALFKVEEVFSERNF